MHDGVLYKTCKASREKIIFENFQPFQLFYHSTDTQGTFVDLQRLLQNWTTTLVSLPGSLYFASLQELKWEKSKRLQCGAGTLPKVALSNFLVYCRSLVNAACYNKQKVPQ